jgi:hypothetical protein
VELSSTVGAKQVHEVHGGGNATPGCSAATLGLSLAEVKSVLAGLQRHLVQAQAEEHCQVRRRCPRCGGQRPLKDQRPRQLGSLLAPKPGATPNEAALRQFAMDHAMPVKHPRRIFFRAVLPLSGTNKIDRAALMREATGAMGR